MPSIPSSGPLSLKDLHDDFKKFPTTNPTNISLNTLIQDYLCVTTTNKPISEFYNSTYLNPFIISETAGDDAEDTCEIPRPNFGGKGAALAYHNGTGTNPVKNDTVYTSYKGLNGASCSNTTWPSGFYRMDNGDVLNVLGTGVVKGVTECE